MPVREDRSKSTTAIGPNDGHCDRTGSDGALRQLEAERNGSGEVFSDRRDILQNMSALGIAARGHWNLTMALTQRVAPVRSRYLATTV